MSPVESNQSEDAYETPKVFQILCVIRTRLSANGA